WWGFPRQRATGVQLTELLRTVRTCRLLVGSARELDGAAVAAPAGCVPPALAARAPAGASVSRLASAAKRTAARNIDRFWTTAFANITTPFWSGPHGPARA